MTNQVTISLDKLATDKATLNAIKTVYVLNTKEELDETNVDLLKFVKGISKPISEETISMMFGSMDVAEILKHFLNDLVADRNNIPEFTSAIKILPLRERLLFLTRFVYDFMTRYPECNFSNLHISPFCDEEYLNWKKAGELISYDDLIYVIETLGEDAIPSMMSVITALTSARLDNHTEIREEDPDWTDGIIYDSSVLENINDDTPDWYRKMIARRMSSAPYIQNGRDIPLTTRYDIGLVYGDHDPSMVRRKTFSFEMDEHDVELDNKYGLALVGNIDNLTYAPNAKYLTPTTFPIPEEIRATIQKRIRENILPADTNIEDEVKRVISIVASNLITPEHIADGTFDELLYAKAFAHEANIPSELGFRNLLGIMQDAIIANKEHLILLPKMLEIPFKKEGCTSFKTLGDALRNPGMFVTIDERSWLTKFVRDWLDENTTLNLRLDGVSKAKHQVDLDKKGNIFK
ncbi:hypothetical protein [Proteus mirabilis]|uniref:hypothetical protein n=1 Tax=Proteus mirabilis TaxID=584 RepID=UPI0034D4548C